MQIGVLKKIRKRKNKKSVYLTLHSNGSLWSMYEEYYPLFRSCFFGIMKRRIEDVVLNLSLIHI